ncbi:MAG: hypothetical protein HY077_09170 [Elusimicrobia bacterium]|nr:hypothetical protein [Elusimicrobiota bacterium]
MNKKIPAKYIPHILTFLLIALKGWAGLMASRAPWRIYFGDVGQWVDAGDRMLAGQVPYRDFFGLYGPLLYAWSALCYRLAGANWFAALLTLEVVSPVLCLLLIHYTAARAFKDISFQCLFIVAAAWIGLDHFFWSPALRVWVPLAALLFAQQALLRPAPVARLAAAGLLLGAAPLISPETGIAALAAGAVLAACRCRLPGPRGREVAVFCAASLAPAVLLGALEPGVVGGYARMVTGLARIQNWSGGMYFPSLSPLSTESAVFYGPPVFVIAAFFALVPRSAGRAGGSSFAEDAGDLSLAAFSCVLVRTMLGCTDYSHLLFALPPATLLWLRLFARLPRLPKAAAAALAGLGLAPFIVKSTVAGYTLPLCARQRYGLLGASLAPWPGEGIATSAEIVSRAQAAASEIKELSPAGEDVLSLPLPFYAHAGGRLSALPFPYPDTLLGLDDGPARSIARLESRKVALLLMDPALLPAPSAREFADPLSGRLSWVSAADEAVTRELRAYLRSRFELKTRINGMAFYGRRARPLPPPRERVVYRCPSKGALDPERESVFAVPGVRCAELRIKARCSYPPLLSMLAKTVLTVVVRFDAGAPDVVEILPIPPERLGRDIRISFAPARVRSISVRAAGPGGLNPPPRALAVDSIDLVSYKGR